MSRILLNFPLPILREVEYKQSSANWYDCLKKGLERRGFRESKADPCVFMKKGMIILTYVDDFILIANKKETLDQFIHSLENDMKISNLQMKVQ